MLTRLPIISASIDRSGFLRALRRIGDRRLSKKFNSELSLYLGLGPIYLTNSGISSFYLILEGLKEESTRKEVILPAYTAGSLVVAVRKAGLKPVLCDISLEDFNLDTESLHQAISLDTLAVVCVHMFGIGAHYIEELRNQIPHDTSLIEDCAQSMGTRIGQKYTGSFGDLSFFSFNRGKNLPAFGGGCIVVNSGELTRNIDSVYLPKIKDNTVWSNFSLPLKALAFSLASNPVIYCCGYPVISLFKETAPPEDFSVRRIHNFQAGLGLELMRKKDEIFAKRHDHGTYLLDALSGIPGIALPKIREDIYVVFNRLPILFQEPLKVDAAEKKLLAAGIEASRMYLEPLHHMFELGYKKEEFPNAVYFSERLLTLPVHPLVRQQDLERIVEVIGKI